MKVYFKMVNDCGDLNIAELDVTEEFNENMFCERYKAVRIEREEYIKLEKSIKQG